MSIPQNEYEDESRSDNAPAFLRSEGIFVYTGRVRRSRKRNSVVIPPPPKTKCSRYERCEGCPYTAHGFVCWHTDDSCLKTDMMKISERKDSNVPSSNQ